MQYELKPSRKQVAMVLDLNKCLGCHTCTVACKKLWNTDQGTDYAYWNNVETMPGKGYPAQYTDSGGRTASGEVKRGRVPNMDAEYGRAWTFNHASVIATDAASGTKEWLRPNEKPKWGPNWDEDHGEGSYPRDNHYFYLPRLCNHCTHPACLDACPRGAIHKREEDGIVLVDQDRCHGYRFCVEACPYKKVYFDYQRQVAAKCIFCLPRVEEGVAPACARQCPGRLRYVGFRDDREGPIWKLVDEWKVALPLHPEYGLGPNVFYVPPLSPPKLDAAGRPLPEMRIPVDYLKSLFGPEVEQAMATLTREREKRRRGEASELMDTLIAYVWEDNFRLGANTREVL
ncbi:MAG: 4Fe-4S dicluster domain-containing protein [Gammaproteobacteria bacterium]|jgi:DMSO reductase family type II enzyme iron-sulfur subunit|nr:4Fe-4S dicluster domain-containing protein [Gammaproteobacteria bacterium]MBK9468727.1 4Fe-4S dicluster domain-containing protein [Gammaproteobacteria bacterium]MBP6482524.1 4Fe-4S dicluster domain-containing protein [Pseudomonadales bacterium]MBP7911970.1 4Fe-4S dicluster domain-containing protein [Pseudomonadales bacterium]